MTVPKIPGSSAALPVPSSTSSEIQPASPPQPREMPSLGWPGGGLMGRALSRSNSGSLTLAEEAPRLRTALPGSQSGGESPMLDRRFDHTPTYSPVTTPPRGHTALQIESGSAASPQAQAASAWSRFTAGVSHAAGSARNAGSWLASGVSEAAGSALGNARSAGSRVMSRVSHAGRQVADGTRAAAGAAATTTVSAGRIVLDDTKRLLKPMPHLAAVLAGHTLQQAVTCGIPTFAREMVAMGLTMSLAERPNLAAGLQAGMTVINIAAQVMRHHQIKRHPDVAARGFEGLSEAQWRDKTPQEQQAIRDRQQASSREVTYMHLAAMVVNAGVTAYGLASGNGVLVASSVASDVRNLVYAGMRESLQASFGMVGLDAPRSSSGVSPDGMNFAAAVYGGAQAAAPYLQNYLTNVVSPDALSVAGSVVSYTQDHGLIKAGELVGVNTTLATVAAKASLVRAAVNTLAEVLDAYQLKHQEAKGAGGTQKWSPEITGVDYARLMDHSPARMAWNGFAGSVGDLTTFMKNSDLKSMLSNFGTALAFAVTYKPISQTYQAQAAVRSHVRSQAAENQPADRVLPRLARWLSQQTRHTPAQTPTESPARTTQAAGDGSPSFRFYIEQPQAEQSRP